VILTALPSFIFHVIIAFFNSCFGSELLIIAFFRYHQGKGTLSIIEHLAILIARLIHVLGTKAHIFTIFFHSLNTGVSHETAPTRYNVHHATTNP
jgi:hypothetical protein